MINHATLLGRVGRKDLRKIKSGGEMTTFSLATSRKHKDASGNFTENTTWHNVCCFSKLAEIAQKYINVGDLVCVQGEIQYKKIETGERAGQYSYSINASDIKFIPTGKGMSSQFTGKTVVETQTPNTKNPENYPEDIPW